jgi:AraC-like DNA-binding protein
MVKILQKEYPAIRWIQAPDSLHRANIFSEEIVQPASSLCLFSAAFREIQEFAAKGFLLPLEKDFSKKTLSRYEPSAVEHCKRNGRLYGIPEDVTSYGVVLHREMWAKEKLPIPNNWAELEKGIRHFRKKGKPFIIMSKPIFILNLLGSNGIDLSPSHDLLQHQRKLIEAYHWLKKFESEFGAINESKTSPFWKVEFQLNFEQKNISCCFIPISSIARWSRALQKQIAVIPIPHGPSGNPSFMALHGHGWCIPSNTFSPKQSIKILQKIQDLGVLKRVDLQEGFAFPAHQGLWKDQEVLQKNPSYAIAADFLSARKLFETSDWAFFGLIIKFFFNALEQKYSDEKFIHELSAICTRDVSVRIRHPALRAAVNFIHNHLHEIQDVKAVAKKVRLSVVGLNLIFQKEIKMSCAEYLKTIRMKRARNLLVDSQIFIKEIADQLGFDNPAAFGNAFKRHWGESPQEYRARVLK